VRADSSRIDRYGLGRAALPALANSEPLAPVSVPNIGGTLKGEPNPIP
jgi:hypothetical protein